jgi:ABC-type nitrate/sulfonate/bicarbonate transport system permease component
MQLNNPIFINQTDADVRYVNTLNNQNINGVKTFTNSGIFTSGINLNNSNLINATPQIINLSANFNISGNYNSRMVMVNSANEVTGSIISGNSLGFNATIMQVGVGQVLITGSGIGIRINEYANQFRTAGAFAAVTLLHTGTNGYVMYGNTGP